MNPIKMIPMICVMGVIFFLSHQTFGSDTPSFPGADKIAHLFIYTVLASTILYAVRPEIRKKTLLTMAVVMVITVLYGASDEFHQSFVPGRQPDIADLLADSCGGLLVCITWLFKRDKRQGVK